MAKRAKRIRDNHPKIPIDKLLAYWVQLSKQPVLTQEEFRTFVEMSQHTFRHFEEHYNSLYRGP